LRHLGERHNGCVQVAARLFNLPVPRVRMRARCIGGNRQRRHGRARIRVNKVMVNDYGMVRE